MLHWMGVFDSVELRHDVLKYLIDTAARVPPTLLVMATQMVSAHCSIDARPNFMIRTGAGRET